MSSINFNHWFVEENTMSINLMRFSVRIETYVLDNNLSYTLVVTNSKQENLILLFNTLEEAVTFTERDVTLCDDFASIIELYKTNVLKLEKKEE